MKIAVIGASGMTGAGVVAELLDRGHQVTGLVRDTARLAPREGLTAVATDVMRPASITAALRGHDAVVSAFAPGHGMGTDMYKGAVEAAWRLKRAVKAAGEPYLVTVGGVGSLWTERGVQMIDDPRWPDWYLNTSSPAYLRHLHTMTGHAPFELLAREREQIVAAGGDPHADFASAEAKAFIAALGTAHELAQGCRAQLEIFEHDRTFAWTFVSPPWVYMVGPRSGQYRITLHDMPLEDGVPAGISIPDFAVAIADELQARRLVHQHWCASSVQA